jgi:hypothetical protein
MSTADHATCCCADTLAEVARLTAERDRARALAIRLEAEAAQPYLPAGPFPLPHRDPTPIIEWAASVGLDAKGIPADGVRIIGRTPLGGCLLLVQSFEVAADGKRVILADGSGFARTRHRRIEVTTLPPEPWLSTWGGWRGSPPTPCPCLDAPPPQDRPQESP